MSLLYRQDPQRIAIHIGEEFPLIKSKRNQLEMVWLLGTTTGHQLCESQGLFFSSRVGRGWDRKNLSFL